MSARYQPERFHTGDSGGMSTAAPAPSASETGYEAAGLRLRLIRIEEMSAVGALARAAYAEDYPGLPADYLTEIAAVAERARSTQVWVAEDTATGELTGTVTLPEPGRVLSAVAQEGEMDVRLLAVARTARGRGVGGLLMQHAIATARERGAHRLVLNTSTEMPGARRLYERLGFVRLVEREEDRVESDGRAYRLLAYGLDL